MATTIVKLYSVYERGNKKVCSFECHKGQLLLDVTSYDARIVTVLPPLGWNISNFAKVIEGCFSKESNFGKAIKDVYGTKEDFVAISFEFNGVHILATKENADNLANIWDKKFKQMAAIQRKKRVKKQKNQIRAILEKDIELEEKVNELHSLISTMC